MPLGITFKFIVIFLEIAMDKYRVLERKTKAGKISYIAQHEPTIHWINIGEFKTLDKAIACVDECKAASVDRQKIVYEI